MTAITNPASLGATRKNGFEPVPLKRLVTKIGSGKTPAGGSEAYFEQGVPFIRSQNVHFDGLRLDDIVFIDEATHAEMSSTAVQPHDVLLNITGASLGRTTLVPVDLDEANVNQHVCICRPRRKTIEAGYLCYTLQSAPVQSEIWGTQVGASREGLNFEEVGNLPVFVPLGGLRKQRSITSFLDRKTGVVDEMIDKKGRLIELLEEKRAALINRAVTKGLDPDMPMKDSGIPTIGQIPHHWAVERNKVLFREWDMRSTTGQEELLTVSHKTGVTPRSEKDVNMFMAESLEGYKKCSPGDLVINTMWGWMGALGVTMYEGIVSPSYHVYRPVNQNVFPPYYDLLYRTPTYVAEITRFSRGVWSSRLRIYPETFLGEMHSPIPPREEQEEIVAHIRRETDKVDQLADVLERALIKLQEYRQSLITAAVTGQIDIAEEAVDLTNEEVEGAWA